MSMKEKERQRTYFKERFSYQTKEPKRYTIVIYNDDFTPMDFVMDLLMKVLKLMISLSSVRGEAVKLHIPVTMTNFMNC